MEKEMLAEAQAEWVARGFPMEEFRMDKLAEIWAKEEAEELEAGGVGSNNLDRKMELARTQGEASFSVGAVVKVIKARKAAARTDAFRDFSATFSKPGAFSS